jgi:hypothetical protein
MSRPWATIAAKIATQSCLVVVFATTSVETALVTSGCSTDMDCYLNGVCSSLPLNLPGAGGTTASRVCTCYPGWTGPHCGQFDFLPTPPGPLGGKAFPNFADSSCWGSSVIKGADGKYHMYSSGILGKCGLAVWGPNAALTHAVSGTLDGVYLPQQDIMRGSNPQITQFGDELRLWHILGGGPGGPDTKFVGRPPFHCSDGSALSSLGAQLVLSVCSCLCIRHPPRKECAPLMHMGVPSLSQRLLLHLHKRHHACELSQRVDQTSTDESATSPAWRHRSPTSRCARDSGSKRSDVDQADCGHRSGWPVERLAHYLRGIRTQRRVPNHQ